MGKNGSKKQILMTKTHKRIWIIIILAILLADAALIANELLKEETVEKKQVTAAFINTPGITYKVHLKPNILYNDNVLPEGQGYFSNIIDYISVTIQNKYSGGDGAEFKGDYSITGEITGWEAVTENPVPAWTKQFGIVSKKNFSSTDKELVLSQNANIDFNHFNDFVDQVQELTGYNTAYTLRITMFINYTVTTKDGELTESLQPAITIPLGGDYFKITKSGIDEVKSEISRTIKEKAPVDMVRLIIYATIGLLCLIILIILIRAAEPTLTDIQRKRIRKLIKAYGKRLVAVADDLVDQSMSVCRVHSMDDMVKISDEIERPIFYIYQQDPADMNVFFITDREQAYVYYALDPGTPEEPEESAEKKAIA